jgi:hypothetical protein
VTVSVGHEYADTQIDFELAGGKFEKLSISDYLDRLITFTIGRAFLLTNLLVRELTPYAI